ncbi:peroxin 8-like protein [Seiridium cupressi]
MSVDRLLTAALRAFQEPPNAAETNKIFATTTTLLSNLNNPLNISLLTSHVLTARAIWEFPNGLRTCLRIISIYNTGAKHMIQNEQDNAKLAWGQQPAGSGMRPEAWARAVAKGADDRSSRWKHLLVLTGILTGMESEERRTLSSGLRSTLEQAVVAAANLALEDPVQTQEYGLNAVVLALTYAFPVLSDWNKRSLNCNLVLPATIRVMTGLEGFQGGEFLRTISAGDVAGHEAFYRASPESFAQVQQVAARPLVQNMGPLSRVAAFAVENVTDSSVVLQAQDSLLAFSADLLDKWRHCPFSAIDVSAEPAVLEPEIQQGPWNLLWQLLKKLMYAVVGTLQPIVGRCLLDPRLRNDAIAPTVASRTLHTLRNIYFISSRGGADAFQVYTFTYLTSIDIISRHPEACISFLQETLPSTAQSAALPPTSLDQALTLFYLNLAEHLPLSLPTTAADSLILSPATAHLSVASSTVASSLPRNSLTMPLFEASHSAILSVMSCPQHADHTVAIIPFYVDSLLQSFPARISPRQFRLAFKTIMQIVSPPFPISATHPDLSEILLETLHFRSASANSLPLPPEPAPPSPSPLASQQPPANQVQQTPISEQTTLVLALIDALPFLPLPIVDEWLSRTAEAMNAVPDAGMREVARKRFWDVLVSGEMDVERAAIGVFWWGTGGGRDMVLLNAPRSHDSQERSDEYLMSGALGSKNESRL